MSHHSGTFMTMDSCSLAHGLILQFVNGCALNNKVGFEVAKDAPPYMGARGIGTATLKASSEVPILATLIGRYLGSTESKLAKWLLSKPENESTICLKVERITSWDYSKRM